MRPAPILAALLCAALLAQTARAGEVTLTQSAEPSVYHPAGRAIDVLGIVPGMAPSSVHAILAKQFGDVQTVKENLGLEDHGDVVATQPFITKMLARKDSDEITVWFATPTTGASVVEVSRQTTYFDAAAAPAMAQARAELIAKYGPPAFDGPVLRTGEMRLLAWSYQGDKPTPCPQSSCRAYLSDGLEVGDMATYKRAVGAGHELTIVATLLSSVADPAKALSVMVAANDAATKLHTLEAAVSQMRAGFGAPASAGKPRR